jgi:hypothetical protein
MIIYNLKDLFSFMGVSFRKALRAQGISLAEISGKLFPRNFLMQPKLSYILPVKKLTYFNT